MTKHEYETIVSVFDNPDFLKSIDQFESDIDVFWKRLSDENQTFDDSLISLIRKKVEDYDIELRIEAEVEWTYTKELVCGGTSCFTLDWDDERSAESYIDDHLCEDVEYDISSRGGRRYLEEGVEAEITQDAIRCRFTLGDIKPPSEEAA